MKILASYLMMLLVMGVLTATVASWGKVLRAWLLGKSPLEGLAPPSRIPSLWGVVDLLVNVAIFIVLSKAAVETLEVFGLVGEGKELTVRQKSIPILALGIAQLAAVILGTVFACWRANVSAAEAGWDLREAAGDVGLGIFAFGLVIVPVFLVQGLLVQFVEYQHPAITPFRESKDWVYFAAASFSAVLVAPLAEEYFFRGLLQGWLERVGVLGAKDLEEIFAPRKAPAAVWAVEPAGGVVEAIPLAPGEQAYPVPHWPVWVTSAIFALLHMSQGPAPVPLFLFSVALGYVYRKTGRILPSLVMHFLLNGASMAMLGLSTFLPQATDASKALH